MDLANHQYHNAFLNTSVKTNKHVRQFRELKHDSEGGCVSHQEDRRPLSDRDAPAETSNHACKCRNLDRTRFFLPIYCQQTATRGYAHKQPLIDYCGCNAPNQDWPLATTLQNSMHTGVQAVRGTCELQSTRYYKYNLLES